MEVLFVSQCDHKALKESRRILDQFACRTGERCWQTPMTEKGLETLHKMLSSTARKNTAVACHRIGGRGGAELKWIVGDWRRFDAFGKVPTQSTELNLLRLEDENHWDSGESVRLLARMAGLLHDLGKASRAFQEKLKATEIQPNLLRHEYQSARLFAYFVRQSGTTDADWLKRLEQGEGEVLSHWLPAWGQDFESENKVRIFENLPPLAKAILWLIFSHHRLPVSPDSAFFGGKVTGLKLDLLNHPLAKVSADWNNQRPDSPHSFEKYHDFGMLEGVLQSTLFSKSLKNTAKRLLSLEEKQKDWHGWQEDLYILHLARLSLMLADHHVSSWERVKLPPLKKGQAVANTGRDNAPKQSLVCHLTEIAKQAGSIACFLEKFTRPLTVLPSYKMKRFRQRVPATLPDYVWQNKAWDEALEIRSKALEKGAFIVNMASTGSGKTLGNGKILAALTSEKKPLRMTYALGLRVLTHQTGEVYREHLSLEDQELGVFVGGAVSQEIAAFLEEKSQEKGSESEAFLLPEEIGEMAFETDPSKEEDWEKYPLLSAVYGVGQENGRRNKKDRSFLDAPILVCTVDHLAPATEAWRGGHQINPMLRLMSSDLILDELDDYALEDLPALTRLVWYSGMLGRKVLLSSATLPESLVRGMFLAYRAGREIYLKNHGGYSGASASDRAEIPCLWVDEFNAKSTICPDEAVFKAAHQKFAQKRAEKLLKKAKEKPLRQGKIIGQGVLRGNLQEKEIYPVLARLYREEALKLHKAHGEEIQEGVFQGKKLSFGLIRMANIRPLYRVSQAFFELGSENEETQFHLCVYHSRFPLICRSAIEAGLDRIFNRKTGKEGQENKPWQKREVREILAQSPKTVKNHIFIVLASPVCEVGRDWDADWAIAEPSSLRSIIQLAGRVQRHRKKAPKSPNLLLLHKNVKAIKGGGKVAYEKPGYESQTWQLKTHDLETLLRAAEYKTITSIPRLLEPPQRLPRQDWEVQGKNPFYVGKIGDLELAKTKEGMDAKPKKWGNPQGRAMGQREAALCWWQDFSETSLTGLLAQNQPFREQSFPQIALAFVWDTENEKLCFQQAVPTRGKEQLYVSAERSLVSQKISFGKNITPWNTASLEGLLKEWLENFKGESEESVQMEARRMTAFSAYKRDETQKWQFNDVLGLDLI
ncbi:type I-F CRISPR-associated helicase Cas3 [Acetobacteraceae bacterium]|nr:type I-F CRISPR-associated helicase Cas3 [Acetobacteraceae bacterium]